MAKLTEKDLRFPPIPAEDLCELRFQNNAARRVVLVNGNLVANVRSDEAGVSARVRKDGYYGFASLPSLTEEAALKVLNSAAHNARFMADHAEALQKKEPPRLMAFARPMREAWNDVGQSRYVALCREFDEYICQHCPQIVARSVVAYSDTLEKHLRTAEGTEAHFAQPRAMTYFTLTAEAENGGTVDLTRVVGGFGSLDQVFDEAGKAAFHAAVDEAYRYVLDKAKAVAPRSGLQQVILHSYLSGMLAHEAVGHTTEADFVLGGSVSGHCMQKKVASDLVTLVDFANTALGKRCPCPVYVDDEGVAAEDVTIIEKGTLIHYMHNRDTAARLGGKACGNARAWLYSDEPLIRMRNTAILPGKDRLEDMIASIEDGYYLLDTGNGQADSTGEFMFGITMGYEIKNGKLGRAIRDTTISGFAFDMLKTVDMVSDDMVWMGGGFCGKKQPMAVGMGGASIRCQITMGG